MQNVKHRSISDLISVQDHRQNTFVLWSVLRARNDECTADILSPVSIHIRSVEL